MADKRVTVKVDIQKVGGIDLTQDRATLKALEDQAHKTSVAVAAINRGVAAATQAVTTAIREQIRAFTELSRLAAGMRMPTMGQPAAQQAPARSYGPHGHEGSAAVIGAVAAVGIESFLRPGEIKQPLQTIKPSSSALGGMGTFFQPRVLEEQGRMFTGAEGGLSAMRKGMGFPTGGAGRRRGEVPPRESPLFPPETYHPGYKIPGGEPPEELGGGVPRTPSPTKPGGGGVGEEVERSQSKWRARFEDILNRAKATVSAAAEYVNKHMEEGGKAMGGKGITPMLGSMIAGGVSATVGKLKRRPKIEVVEELPGENLPLAEAVEQVPEEVQKQRDDLAVIEELAEEEKGKRKRRPKRGVRARKRPSRQALEALANEPTADIPMSPEEATIVAKQEVGELHPTPVQVSKIAETATLTESKEKAEEVRVSKKDIEKEADNIYKEENKRRELENKMMEALAASLEKQGANLGEVAKHVGGGGDESGIKGFDAAVQNLLSTGDFGDIFGTGDATAKTWQLLQEHIGGGEGFLKKTIGGKKSGIHERKMMTRAEAKAEVEKRIERLKEQAIADKAKELTAEDVFGEEEFTPEQLAGAPAVQDPEKELAHAPDFIPQFTVKPQEPPKRVSLPTVPSRVPLPTVEDFAAKSAAKIKELEAQDAETEEMIRKQQEAQGKLARGQSGPISGSRLGGMMSEAELSQLPPDIADQIRQAQGGGPPAHIAEQIPEERPDIKLTKPESEATRLPQDLSLKGIAAEELRVGHQYEALMAAGNEELQERINRTRALQEAEASLVRGRVQMMQMYLADRENLGVFKERARVSNDLRLTSAQMGRAEAGAERQQIGSPMHLAAMREEMQLRKDQRLNQRLEQRVGREVEFGKIGADLLGVADKFEAFGKATTRAFLVSSAAIAGFVRAASPEAFDTLTGQFGILAGEIGSAFLPQIMQVSTWVLRAAAAVAQLDPEIKQNIVTWTMWGLGITGAGFVLGRIAPILRMVATGIGFIGPSVLGVAAGFIALADATGLLQPMLEGVGNVLGTVGQSLLHLDASQVRTAAAIGGLGVAASILIPKLIALRAATAGLGIVGGISAMWGGLANGIMAATRASLAFVATPLGAFITASVGALAVLTNGFGLFGSSVDRAANTISNLERQRNLAGNRGAMEAPGGVQGGLTQRMLDEAFLFAPDQAHLTFVRAGTTRAMQQRRAQQLASMDLPAFGPIANRPGQELARMQEAFRAGGITPEQFATDLQQRLQGFNTEVGPYRAYPRAPRRIELINARRLAMGLPVLTPAAVQEMTPHLEGSTISPQQMTVATELGSGQARMRYLQQQLAILNQIASHGLPAALGGAAANFVGPPRPEGVWVNGRQVPQGILNTITGPAMAMSMQPRQIEIDALHDIVQNESIRSDLEQVRFMQHMDNLRQMVTWLERNNTNLEDILRALGRLPNQMPQAGFNP